MATQPAKEGTLDATLRVADRVLTSGTKEFERWWAKQQPRVKLGTVLGALLVAVLVVNTFLGAVGRMTSRPATVQTTAQSGAVTTRANSTPLAVELAPKDAGKVWSLTKQWQGHASFQSEEFIVTDHWRIDWLFNPQQPGDALKVFIHSATGTASAGARLQIATNTHLAGADSSFWVGPGAYYLVVDTIGGDWKLDVQELR